MTKYTKIPIYYRSFDGAKDIDFAALLCIILVFSERRNNEYLTHFFILNVLSNVLGNSARYLGGKTIFCPLTKTNTFLIERGSSSSF